LWKTVPNLEKLSDWKQRLKNITRKQWEKKPPAEFKHLFPVLPKKKPPVEEI